MSKREHQNGSLRGISLFAAVLEELVGAIGHEVSTKELMQAAQYLVEISKNDYVIAIDQEREARPNYYSTNVCDAIERKQVQIMCFEQLPVEVFDRDDISPEGNENLRRVLLSLDDRRWEF